MEYEYLNKIKNLKSKMIEEDEATKQLKGQIYNLKNNLADYH